MFYYVQSFGTNCLALLENIGSVLSLLSSLSCYFQRIGKDKEAKIKKSAQAAKRGEGRKKEKV